MTRENMSTKRVFQDLLAGLRPGQLQAWGLLDVMPLFPAGERGEHAQFVSPLEHLKVVRVASYGTLILQNTAKQGTVIAPMHIGFFQTGAQNHATSRALILKAGQTLTAEDCFCIQAAQGGYLKEAQQRFIILPLGLRTAALAQRGQKSFSRLWGEIDTHNRRYGIARGGHLERFLRPYFHRLMIYRHAIEIVPGQVGAAYFVAGNLVGVEVAPNAAYWADVGPILNIYCYGAAALLAERHQLKAERQVVDLEGLTSIDDLARLRQATREQEALERCNLIEALARLPWPDTASGSGLRIIDLAQGEWAGQMVKEGSEMVYLSLFRDVVV
ncbi:MAG TPA: hypothetical protein VKR06_04120 [Ktedonosporobacter sp.]|nr:hypothetical protein [Ktedonosporobacter sp.]